MGGSGGIAELVNRNGHFIETTKFPVCPRFILWGEGERENVTISQSKSDNYN